MNKIICFVLTLVLSSFYTITDQNKRDVAGTYRLRFEETFPGKSPCWWSTITHEELLKLNSDSTYVTTRISPQGAFQVLPDSGTWMYKHSKIILISKCEHNTYKRYFKVFETGIKEQHCKEKIACNMLWLKEL